MGHSQDGYKINGIGGVDVRADIETVLGESTGDLGELCRSSEINKWAMYKPVRSSEFGYVLEYDLKDMMYGLKVTKYSSPTSLLNGFYGEWEYLQPRANGWNLSPKEIYRVFDFVKMTNGAPDQSHGYNHKAECQVLGWTPAVTQSSYKKGTGPLTLHFGITAENQLPQDSITLSSLPSDSAHSRYLNSYYFGILLFAVRTGATVTYEYQGIVTSTNPMSYSALNDVEFSDSSFEDFVSYKFVPVFSPVAYATLNYTTNFTNSEIIAAPNTEILTLEIVPQAADFGVDNLIDPNTGYFLPIVSAYYNNGRLTVNLDLMLYGTLHRQVTYTVYAGEDTTGTVIFNAVTMHDGTFDPDGEEKHVSNTAITANPDYITVTIDLMPLSSLEGLQLGYYDRVPVTIPPIE